MSFISFNLCHQVALPIQESNEPSHFQRHIREKPDFHLNRRLKFMFILKIRLVIKSEGQREGVCAKDHLGAIHVGGDRLLFNKT